ncbi:Aste57867_19358 [Aphanomyces stellatus]|uniref:Aste57867_19358 protein n=1 Tax=Aphanomyces stellatus TaxID=120398 RepID=A0A485LGL1_9STRA|nr:hypothetical protein As57867_019294 [Aphanomyces stellatus]VFT96072.1 Aste57867_19358 [Aphanomyces stellatus]
MTCCRPKSSGKLAVSKVCDLRDPDNTTTSEAPLARPQTSYNHYPFSGMTHNTTPRLASNRRPMQKPSSASCTRPSPRRPPPSTPRRSSNNSDDPPRTAASSSSSWLAATRPVSPLPVAPAAVVDHLAHELHPHVKPGDLAQVHDWLQSLDRESHHFTSYFLFCELKFQETAVLTTGKDVPNRLRTAVAFHCLRQATSLFGRYQNVLDTICQNLGCAIYTDYDRLAHDDGRDVPALEWYGRAIPYFEMSERHRDEADTARERLSTVENEKQELEDELQLVRSQCDALRRLQGRVSHRPSLVMQLQGMGTMDKVDMIYKSFQSFDEPNRRNILVGLIQTAEPRLSSDTMYDIVNVMDHDEVEKLAHQLMRDFGATAPSAKKAPNPNVAKLQRLVTGFGATLKEMNKPLPVTTSASTAQNPEDQAERATFEKMLLLKTEMQQMKENHEVELQFEADKIKLLEEECKEWMAKYHDALKRIPKPVDTADQSIQADLGGGGGDLKRKKKRGGGDMYMSNDDDDDDGFHGISDIIADANLSAKKIRKIFSKKRAMTLDDVTGQIVSLYQAKMTQDIHDDNNGKPRASFLNLIDDLFILYYGLKELAIGQLIVVDTAIHKYCETNARVRLFGMLVGSNATVCATQPMGPSPEAIDFFMFVVGVLFHVGHYTTQYEHALAVAKLLKARFGDGVPHSPRSTRIAVQEAIHVVQICFAFDSTTESQEESEVIQLVQALALNESIDIDQFLEQVMLHWFSMYDTQVAFMQKLFHSMDRDKNGVLEFHEFSGVVQKLDPEMTQRDTLAMYNRVAGADNVIDCKEFTAAMISHQQHLILKTYFGNAKLKDNPGRRPSLKFQPQKTLEHLSTLRDHVISTADDVAAPAASVDTNESAVRPGRKASVANLPCNILGRLRDMANKNATDEFVDDEPEETIASVATSKRRSFSSENWDTNIDDIISSVMARDGKLG